MEKIHYFHFKSYCFFFLSLSKLFNFLHSLAHNFFLLHSKQKASIVLEKLKSLQRWGCLKRVLCLISPQVLKIRDIQYEKIVFYSFFLVLKRLSFYCGNYIRIASTLPLLSQLTFFFLLEKRK